MWTPVLPGLLPTVDLGMGWPMYRPTEGAIGRANHDCAGGGGVNHRDVAPSLPVAAVKTFISTAMLPDLMQPPAMMGPHQCHSNPFLADSLAILSTNTVYKLWELLVALLGWQLAYQSARPLREFSIRSFLVSVVVNCICVRYIAFVGFFVVCAAC